MVRDDDLLVARHHTGPSIPRFPTRIRADFLIEAQIAAKAAKTTKTGRDLTQEEIEEDEDDALLTTLAPGGDIEARHHTGMPLLSFPS